MIEKKTASEIHSLGGSYTTLPNQSLWEIGDATSLGIWALLISKPKSWKINRDNVCSALNVKPRQYYVAINRLKEVGLCREFCIRQQGKLKGKEIVIVSSVHDWDRALAKLNEYGVERNIRFVDVTIKSLERIENKKEQEATINPENSVCRDSQKQKSRETELSVAEFSAGENSAGANSLYNKEEIKEKEIKEAAARPLCSEASNSPEVSASFAAAASFSQEDNSAINETIDEKLTLVQIHRVKKKLSSVVLNTRDSVATVQHAVLTSLIDETQFSASHPNFAKKLNAIAKCYRAGTYFPETVLAVKQQAQQVQKDQQAQQRLNDLREKYRQLAGDINHYETLLRANLTVDEAVEYAPIYAEKKRVLETMKHEIDVLKTQLGQSTNKLSFPEKRVGIEQPNTALSTGLPTKTVNNSAADNGHVDSKSLGEGGC